MSEVSLPMSQAIGTSFAGDDPLQSSVDRLAFLNRLRRPEWVLGLAGIAALLCAICVQPLAFVAFSAILIIFVIGVGWPWISMRGITGEVEFLRTRTTESQAIPVRLQVRNRWPWPVWGLTLDRGLSSGASGRSDGVVTLDRIAGWSATEFVWEYAPQSRGVYPVAPPQLSTSFPFGLLRAGRAVDSRNQLIVWPRTSLLGKLRDVPVNSASHQATCDERPGDYGDILGTRLFRHGDSLRRVHWAQTARQGRLIVCERQSSLHAAIRVVLDLDPRSHVGHDQNSTLEWTIRLGASLAQIYHQNHAQVDMHFGNRDLNLATGEAGWKRLQDELARIPVRGVDSGERLKTCSHRGQHDRLEVVITTDLGLQRHQHLHHPCGRQLCVVLRTEAFAPVAGGRGLSLCAAHHWLVIDSARDVFGTFRRQWQGFCDGR